MTHDEYQAALALTDIEPNTATEKACFHILTNGWMPQEAKTFYGINHTIVERAIRKILIQHRNLNRAALGAARHE